MTNAENAPQSNWFVGASYDRTEDQTPRFLDEGIWENGYDDKHLDLVRSMQPGDTYDRYKRLIAVCYSGTVNLNAELVWQGWALAYRRYSKDFVSAEKEAHAAKRGMWAGEFEPPWEWRRK